MAYSPLSGRPLPSGRRLTTRRGSASAPDPFGFNSDVETSRKIQSRITIVRARPIDVGANRDDQRSISGGAASGSGTSSVNRRASWGTSRNREGGNSNSSTASPSATKRLSFAFSSFTPNSPIIGDIGPARPPTSNPNSGPPSPELPHLGAKLSRSDSDSKIADRLNGSIGGSSLYDARPSISRPAFMSPRLTAEQIYALASASMVPPTPALPASVSSSTSLGANHAGSSAGDLNSSMRDGGATGAGENEEVEFVPSPFIPIPDEIQLPYIDRPTEVKELLENERNARMMNLLERTFPSNPSPVIDISLPPKQWSYATLAHFLKHVPRVEAEDREYVKRARECVMSRSEAIWVRVKSVMGVPDELEEELEEEKALMKELGVQRWEDWESAVGEREGEGEGDADSVFLKSEDGDHEHDNMREDALENGINDQENIFVKSRANSGTYSDVSVEAILPGNVPEPLLNRDRTFDPILNANAGAGAGAGASGLSSAGLRSGSMSSEKSFGFGGRERGMENLDENVEEEESEDVTRGGKDKDLGNGIGIDVEEPTPKDEKDDPSNNANPNMEEKEKEKTKAYPLQNDIQGLRITTAEAPVGWGVNGVNVSPHSPRSKYAYHLAGGSAAPTLTSSPVQLSPVLTAHPGHFGKSSVQNASVSPGLTPQVLVGHYGTPLGAAVDGVQAVGAEAAVAVTPNASNGSVKDAINTDTKASTTSNMAANKSLDRLAALARRRSSLPTHVVAMAEYGLRSFMESVSSGNVTLAERGVLSSRASAGSTDAPSPSPPSTIPLSKSNPAEMPSSTSDSILDRIGNPRPRLEHLLDPGRRNVRDGQDGTLDFIGRVRPSEQQERGTGAQMFPRSFMDVGLEPSLVANNPTLRSGPAYQFRPGFAYQSHFDRRRRGYGGSFGSGDAKSRRPRMSGGSEVYAEGNEYALSLGSGSERSFR